MESQSLPKHIKIVTVEDFEEFKKKVDEIAKKLEQGEDIPMIIIG